jgi:hypothetical protein
MRVVSGLFLRSVISRHRDRERQDFSEEAEKVFQKVAPLASPVSCRSAYFRAEC